jgi:hypothetical protein
VRNDGAALQESGVALSVASRNRRTQVLVAAGLYEEDGLVLPAGVTVQGAWSEIGGVWKRLCDETRAGAVVVRPLRENITLRATDTAQPSRIEALTLTSRATAAAPSESLYGLMARGSSTVVELDEVAVRVADGGRGRDGAPGTAGATAAATGGCSAGNGRTGEGGAAGQPGAGTFAYAGYTATHGTDGMDGVAGGHGVQHANNCNTTCVAHSSEFGACIWRDFGGGPLCVPRGYPNFSTYTTCAEAGTPGCGGGAGTKGAGGGSGGASIGIYAWGAQVRVVRSEVRTGAGGDGGSGGRGGDGSRGSAGSLGGVAVCNRCAFGEPVCSPRGIDFDVVGPAGGAGGNGGAGGSGGGGAGGPSHTIVEGGGAKVEASADSRLVAGPGGGGGAGGRAGAPGGSSVRLTAP